MSTGSHAGLQFEAELKKLRFAPWHFEDVAWHVGNGCADLLLDSSDWPHPEGGKDPIRAFRGSLASFGADQAVQRKFFHDNMAELLGTEGPPRLGQQPVALGQL